MKSGIYKLTFRGVKEYFENFRLKCFFPFVEVCWNDNAIAVGEGKYGFSHVWELLVFFKSAWPVFGKLVQDGLFLRVLGWRYDGVRLSLCVYFRYCLLILDPVLVGRL